MEEFDHNRLLLLQNEIEHETSCERIADLYGEVGNIYLWHVLTSCQDMGEFAKYWTMAWNAYIKLINYYSNNICARNNLAALILLRGVQQENALPYLAKLHHAIIRCRHDDKDLIQPLCKKEGPELLREDKEDLKKYISNYVSCLSNPEYYESERLALKGLTYYVCGKKEYALKYFIKAYTDPQFCKLDLFSLTPLAIVKSRATGIHANQQEHIENILLNFRSLSKTKNAIDRLIIYYRKYSQ